MSYLNIDPTTKIGDIKLSQLTEPLLAIVQAYRETGDLGPANANKGEESRTNRLDDELVATAIHDLFNGLSVRMRQDALQAASEEDREAKGRTPASNVLAILEMTERTTQEFFEQYKANGGKPSTLFIAAFMLFDKAFHSTFDREDPLAKLMRLLQSAGVGSDTEGEIVGVDESEDVEVGGAIPAGEGRY